jgi:hypothetical protein
MNMGEILLWSTMFATPNAAVGRKVSEGALPAPILTD